MNQLANTIAPLELRTEPNKMVVTDLLGLAGDNKEMLDEVSVCLKHAKMDKAVGRGWNDLTLWHDFHEMAQGIRFTISESARQEVLSRLLRLNHERRDEEQKQSALEGEKPKSKGGKKGKKSKSSGEQMELLL